MSAPVDREVLFANFTILTEIYKEIHGQPIRVDVLLPKTLPPGKHPVIIDWHAGGLVSGNRKVYVARWLLPWAARCASVLICPDYRLLPESTVSDIVDDLDSFWTWLHSTLPSVLQRDAPSHTLEATRVLEFGRSSGGYCATMQALSHPDDVRALLVFYPMVALGDEALWSDYEMPGMWSAEQIDEYVEGLEPGKIVTEGLGAERSMLAAGLMRTRRFAGKYGGRGDIFAFGRLEGGAELPRRVLVVHGTADVAIPIKGSERFKELVERYQGRRTEIKLDRCEGGHAFDSRASLDEPWLAQGLRWVEEVWLQ